MMGASTMTRVRVAGSLLLVVLSAGLLIRVTDRAGVPSGNPASVPVELRVIEGQSVIETVDLRNGNLHLQIPIRCAPQKPHPVLMSLRTHEFGPWFSRVILLVKFL